ncbi:MAG: RNA polymerase factor sigma-54 [Verrucomicrobiota bacterium]
MEQPTLRQVISQNQSLQQRQEMAPQQIQSLKILMATIPELEQRLSNEMVENPTLEILDTGTERLAGNPVEESDYNRHASDTDSDNPQPQREDVVNELLQLDNLWQDQSGSGGYSSQQFDDDSEERRQHYFDSMTAEPSLQDALLEQLRQVDNLDDKMLEICEEVIGSIDDRGYLLTHPADIAIACQIDDTARIEEAIRLVQSFDPPGIGARDLRECLMLQLERRGEESTLAYKIVADYLQKLGRNKLNEIAKALHVSIADIDEAVRHIQQLHPHPGTLISPTPHTDFVVPEVYIQKDKNGEWQVSSNSERVPKARISSAYLEMLKRDDVSKEAKSYIRDKINNSKVLLKALENRESTLVSIARSILKYQHDFFEYGVEYLKPLTMSEVAQDIGVHETTVSRAIANKYVMTPHGLFPFRKFFSTGFADAGGQEVSTHVIRQKIRELIAQENKKKPYSDNKLAAMLKDEGFDVARRTVAKYREELGILSSSMRKEY